MATDRLKIYNGALLKIGHRSIASLSVNEEGRRLLDDVWNDDGVRNCLQAAFWKFATRSSQFTPDTGIDPEFGYQNAFAKPTDWVATAAISADDMFNTPLLQYTDEAGYWYSDEDSIYVKYISDDADYGMNYSLWPANFTEYVKTYFAARIVFKLTTDKTLADAFLKKNGLLDQALKTARNSDAQAEPTKFPPEGGWVKARRGGRTRSDGGSSGNLIG